MTTRYYDTNGKRIPVDFVNTFRMNGGTVVEVVEDTPTDTPYNSGKVATKGAGRAVHAVQATPSGYFAACGGSTGNGRLSQGRRVSALRVFDGSLDTVTCKRCLASL